MCHSLTFTNPFPPAGSGVVPKQGVRGIPLNSRKDAWAYDQQWNLTLEKRFGRWLGDTDLLRGFQGHQLAISSQLADSTPEHRLPFADRPDSEKFPWGPNFSFVDQQDLGGSGSFHSMELEATRQFSKGTLHAQLVRI